MKQGLALTTLTIALGALMLPWWHAMTVAMVGGKAIDVVVVTSLLAAIVAATRSLHPGFGTRVVIGIVILRAMFLLSVGAWVCLQVFRASPYLAAQLGASDSDFYVFVAPRDVLWALAGTFTEFVIVLIGSAVLIADHRHKESVARVGEPDKVSTDSLRSGNR